MNTKIQTYWVEGEDESDRNYFTGRDAGAKLLEHLRNNDPMVCGAQKLLKSTVIKLNALKEDERLPQNQIK